MSINIKLQIVELKESRYSLENTLKMLLFYRKHSSKTQSLNEAAGQHPLLLSKVRKNKSGREEHFSSREEQDGQEKQEDKPPGVQRHGYPSVIHDQVLGENVIWNQVTEREPLENTASLTVRSLRIKDPSLKYIKQRTLNKPRD